MMLRLRPGTASAPSYQARPHLEQHGRHSPTLAETLLCQRNRLRRVCKAEAGAAGRGAPPLSGAGVAVQLSSRQQQETPAAQTGPKKPAAPRPRSRSTSSKAPQPAVPEQAQGPASPVPALGEEQRQRQAKMLQTPMPRQQSQPQPQQQQQQQQQQPQQQQHQQAITTLQRQPQNPQQQPAGLHPQPAAHASAALARQASLPNTQLHQTGHQQPLAPQASSRVSGLPATARPVQHQQQQQQVLPQAQQHVICHDGCGNATDHNISSNNSSSGSSTMDISRVFSGRRNLARQQPLSANLRPLTPALLDWFAHLGISPSTLAANGVGTQLIANPLYPEAPLVETIALPYYRSGQLVEMRHLQLAPDGSVAASWLARGGRELYCSDATLKAQGEVIVCCSELDKLAIEEACGQGVAVLAVPQPLPSWKAGESEYSSPRRHVLHLERRLNTLATAHMAAQGVGDAAPADRQPSGAKLLLPNARGVVLAVEAGEAGQAIAGELARLLGEAHCRLVRWPITWTDHWELAGDPAAIQQRQQQQLQDTGYRSCALDMLRMDGACVLQLYVEQYASGFPITGLQHFGDYLETIWKMYSSPVNEQLALSTGWEAVDDIYRVAPGELTLVTGVPNSGKSEWLDALTVNLAELHGWRFAVCSMEKRARDHARQLLEKRARRPMLSAAYAGSVPRMTEQELLAAFEWLNYHFVAIEYGEDEMPSIQWVLDKARSAVAKYGVKGVVIDPFNELDITTKGEMEHEYVSALMGQLRRFAAAEGVHVWLVAHPRQMQNWAGHAPTLNDISGGANFMAKCDNGITVHRDWARHKDIGSRAEDSMDGRGSGRSSPRLGRGSTESRGEAAESSRDGDAGHDSSDFEVRIIVGKVRNKTSGCQGERVLVYDPPTGRYHEPGHPPGHQEMPPPLDPQLRQQIRLFDEVDDARLEEEELAAAAAMSRQALPRSAVAAFAAMEQVVDFDSPLNEWPMDQFG